MKILFTGDFVVNRRYESICKKISPLDKLTKFKNDNGVDYLVVNLEAPISSLSESSLKSGPPLKMMPEYVNTLKGVDLVSLSNNHIMDFGEKGINDTLFSLDNLGVKFVGVSNNSVIEPFVIENGNTRLCVFSVSEQEFNYNTNGLGATPFDLLQLIPLIRKEKVEYSSSVIVMYHGGTEMIHVPNPEYRRNCKLLIEIGADLVIGHHSHYASGVEYYKNKPIYYSLGNIVFDNSCSDSEWEYGLAVLAEFNSNGKISVSEVYTRNHIDEGGVVILSGHEEKERKEKFDIISSILLDESKYMDEWLQASSFLFESNISKVILPFHFKGVGFCFRWLKISRFFLKKKSLLYKLNLLRNPSHREVLLSHLEKKMK
ncbi:TPA: CapA family protein [Vibrio vulnificus]|nr:hypothetical protein [Vibrio vulnificus]HDY7535612.1 CapA family protein [Vibrio vulnificus]HDY8076098.1 CapA family protein [Vibrio vulnificus]